MGNLYSCKKKKQQQKTKKTHNNPKSERVNVDYYKFVWTILKEGLSIKEETIQGTAF